MLFKERQPPPDRQVSPQQVALLDDYIESRARYKEELLDELAEKADAGSALEVCGGYGSLGVRLLQRTRARLYLACENQEAQQRYKDKLLAQGVADRAQLWLGPDGESAPDCARFSLIYAVNRLHVWGSAAWTLRRLYDQLEPGGILILNDLRRDADPYISEYLIREFLAEQDEPSRSHLALFLGSLRAAYTLAEAQTLCAKAGLVRAAFDSEEAMTLTIRVKKE